MINWIAYLRYDISQDHAHKTVAEAYTHHELKRFKIIQKVPCRIKYMGDKRTQNFRIIKITSSFNLRGLGNSNQFNTDFTEYYFNLAFSRIYSRLTGHVLTLSRIYKQNIKVTVQRISSKFTSHVANLSYIYNIKSDKRQNSINFKITSHVTHLSYI